MVLPEISVVVPVFNSEKTLALLHNEIVNSLNQLKVSYEIILVNDCSKDGSWKIIDELMIMNKNIIIGVNNSINLGQIKSTNIGIKMAKGNYIVTIDDDLEYPPSEIITLYNEIISQNYDVVFGISKDKYSLQGKSTHIAKLRNRIINFIWNKPVTDSFKIFKNSILYQNEECLLTHTFESFITQKYNFLRIGYVSINFNKRHHGKSNYTLIKKIKFILEMNKGFK